MRSVIPIATIPSSAAMVSVEAIDGSVRKWGCARNENSANIMAVPTAAPATLLAGRIAPTALACANDACAIGVLELADRLGIAVPARLSVVGFDDIPVASLTRISLTTIAQPVADLARLGVGGLLDRVEGRRMGPPEVRLLAPRLVIRGTTAPPPA